MSQPQHHQAQQGQQAQQPPLDRLQSMLNLVLVTSARVLQDPTKRNPQTGGQTRTLLRQSVPLAEFRFQAALDEIETEIEKAKRVMRRDLALLQNARANREKAEAAERERKAAKLLEVNAPQSTEPATNGHTVEQESSTGNEDVDMEDAPLEKPVAEDTTTDQRVPAPDPDASSHESAAAPDRPPPIQTSHDANQPGSTQEMAQASPTNSLFGKTPTTAGGGKQLDDLDTLFDDLQNDKSPGEQNMNLDSMEGLDFSQMDTHMDANMDSQSGSLLPGLENYASIGDGDNMAYMSNFGDKPADTNTAKNNTDNTNTQDTSDAMDLGTGDGNNASTEYEPDSTFDDLFNFGNEGGDNADGADTIDFSSFLDG
ncbi:hypothetical protein K402DRAFT_454424 [Aulographum hederae CBS 113979]|uniref:Uncharacterized protein n=1 Tax=Aulographum hederae CBS 113979 TaxID=1176131 RepID=A0A6G1H0F3_9PEZI|nr:hypothetical protein K402DRAFT_454424 [Aulographum hederae CBS 113979]